MRNLRQHIRKVQLLENKAAEKAGMRFLLSMDEVKLMKRDSREFRAKYIKLLVDDISLEVVEAAKLGKILNKEIMGE